MRELTGDVWEYHVQGDWVGVTTNGIVKANGEAVMGKGIAKVAALRFPELPGKLAIRLLEFGNVFQVFEDYRLVTFPTKHDWKNDSSIELIEQSAKQLALFLQTRTDINVYLPRPGCGNGNLTWKQVRPVLETYLGTLPNCTVVAQ